MNFFRAQEHARKQTRVLILLFVLAVFSLILITTICVAIFVWYSDLMHRTDTPPGFWPALQHILLNLGVNKFAWIVAIIGGSVGLTSLFRWQDLRQGGRVIAESVGGRLITTNTRDLTQRRLLNVVEEMALASGMPVPPVYLLAHERGINAFAAGVDLEDAVIGVTQGCLDALNREQLQGVIAHEFSHILNGDMRMNQKLVAILAGLMAINRIGRWMLEVGKEGERAGLFLVLLGLLFMVLGWLGHFFGALIRSAVSRQREFLADASAVQFTRNPQGIGGALQVIGGYAERSRVTHHRAHELGHFFFSAAYERSLADLMATHPPLDERIRRVLPSWRGDYLRPDPQIPQSMPEQSEHDPRLNADGSIEFVPANATIPFATIPVETRPQPELTPPVSEPAPSTHPSVRDMDFAWLHRQAREPASAHLLVLALLLQQDAALRQQATQQLPELAAPDLHLLHALLQRMQSLPQDDHLPLLELCMPALKALSTPQYQTLRTQMSRLIHADSQVALFEWALFEIVRQYCDAHFGLRHAVTTHYKSLTSLEQYFICVLTKLVQLGSEHPEARQRAFAAGCQQAGLAEATPFPTEPCPPARFTHAARELARVAPLLKPRILKALIHAAKSDGQIKHQERQLITAISVMMDCPLVGLA